MLFRSQAERAQSEVTNYNGMDNLKMAIRFTGRLILSAIPAVYDTQRVMRIIGEDGKPDIVTINEVTQKQSDDEMAAQTIVKNNVMVGEYDIVMDTGPGYDTKRQESADKMLALMSTPLGEVIAKAGADIVVRQLDFNGAGKLADRLEAMNPMAKIDEDSDIPPKVQMEMQQMQAVIKQQQEKLQQAELLLKYRADIEGMRQEGETRRTLMQETTKAHIAQAENESFQHSVEAKAITSQNVAEINAMASLMGKNIDTRNLEREIASRDIEQQVKNAEQTISPTGE